ncbi:MAG TPA: hypothetical protein VH475_29785 [Tepidisphaeraceae bacterium]|jgi:hypothetical protein
MRFLLAGFLCLCLSTVAFAQARGEVESIGFGGAYRPGCWTPMVIRLTPTTGGTFNGRIEVVQEDLDQDQVIFTRQINLTGNSPSGPVTDQRFWMYFIPQPNRSTDKGGIGQNLSPRDLSEIIKVRLCTDTGKELVKLPITQTLTSADALNAASGLSSSAASRGQKTVLAVYDHSRPNFDEYRGVVGLTEDVLWIMTQRIGTELPDDVRGYDAIDVLLWDDADPMKLSPDQVTAIEAFVKRGGKLVFAQDTATNQWKRNDARFALLMPVSVQGVEERDDKLPTLRRLARVQANSIDLYERERERGWDQLKGPFRYAIGQVKPEAIVPVWQTNETGEPVLDAAGKPKPYVVRWGVGSGSVTWIAQDVGDKQLLGERASTSGWPYVWDLIFDWPNEPTPNPRAQTATENPKLAPYSGGTAWELGTSFLKKYMDLDSTSAALIGIAVLFFVVYWVAAGPGSFLVLSKKGKATLSWFTFAAIAIGATGVTVGIVKLVLRGAPQLKHLSLVRVAPGQPAIVHSEFGLYIPRDGAQRIELKDAAPNKTSYITAFNLHPAFNNNEDTFPARQEYHVPVKEMHEPDREAQDPKVIRVPYRSTLKKFQAEWVGNLSGGGIEGSVKLAPETPIVRGTLTNKTGQNLRYVYLVVHHPMAVPRQNEDGTEDFRPLDVVLYISYWPDGADLKLTDLFEARNKQGSADYINANAQLVDSSNPTAYRAFKGYIWEDARNGGATFANWTDFWYGQSWRRVGYDNRDYDEADPLNPKGLPILSFFDRLPVSRNLITRDKNSSQFDRVDFLRRGVREFDMSASVSAGNMAIVAASDTREEKLPFPLEVQGDRIDGKGTVLYQFVVGVDRSAVSSKPNPSTRPTSQPKGKAEG